MKIKLLFLFYSQIDGKLPVSAREEDRVSIIVSRHGLNVLDSSKKVNHAYNLNSYSMLTQTLFTLE